MFCYLTTEFNKIKNRFDMGRVKELIHFECVWSSDEISFKKQNFYHLRKKDIQINNEIHHRVMRRSRDPG